MSAVGLALALVLWLLATMPDTPHEAQPEIVPSPQPFLSPGTRDALLLAALTIGAIAAYRAKHKHDSEPEFEE